MALIHFEQNFTTEDIGHPRKERLWLYLGVGKGLIPNPRRDGSTGEYRIPGKNNATGKLILNPVVSNHLQKFFLVWSEPGLATDVKTDGSCLIQVSLTVESPSDRITFPDPSQRIDTN